MIGPRIGIWLCLLIRGRGTGGGGPVVPATAILDMSGLPVLDMTGGYILEFSDGGPVVPATAILDMSGLPVLDMTGGYILEFSGA